jgi:transposase
MDTSWDICYIVGMRPYGTYQQLESRRCKALALLRKGIPFREVAAKVKASLSSIVRWNQLHQKKGIQGLKERVEWGRPSHLTPEQKDDLEQRLLKGAVAAGYPTELWTLKRIAKLIEKEYGAHYTSVGIWRLLHLGLNWSCQKPEKRAIERDEENIRRWKQKVWPHIKKRQKTWGPSGLYRRERVSFDSQRS